MTGETLKAIYKGNLTQWYRAASLVKRPKMFSKKGTNQNFLKLGIQMPWGGSLSADCSLLHSKIILYSESFVYNIVLFEGLTIVFLKPKIIKKEKGDPLKNWVYDKWM